MRNWFAAEGQLPSYPDLTRGLVAVLLFYDARRCLVESLRTLIQARRGRAWEVDLPEEVTRVVQTFTDSLWESELPKKILGEPCRLADFCCNLFPM